MAKVLTIGTFDIPHMGHAAFLRKCEAFGEVTVGINSDTFVMEYKGVTPVYLLEDRQAIVESLGYETAINWTAGRELIQEVKPDVIVIGSDWLRKDYLKQIDLTVAYLERMEIVLVYVPYTFGISTSGITNDVINWGLDNA